MKVLNGVIGSSVTRRDALWKITGRAVYPDDIYIDNMLYGATLRSKIPCGKIKSIDFEKARNLKGVVAIFTAEDLPGINKHGVLYKDHMVFCTDRVRRIGDPIAFVVGESKEITEKALKFINVNYEVYEGVFDPLEGLKVDAPVVNEYEDRFFFYDKDKKLLFEKPKEYPFPNLIYRYKCRQGKWLTSSTSPEEEKLESDEWSDSIWKECKAVAEESFHSPFVETAFLQPESGIAYMDEEGRLVVTASTQYMHFDRTEIAEALGIEEERVRIINPSIGGAFGAREDITLQIHIALAALKLGRPVKATYSREESFFTHSKRHPMYIKAKMGADSQGKLMAFEAKIISDSGAYASWAINVTRKAGIHITGPYVIPNVKIDAYAVYTNNPFTGAMRGFGATQVGMVHETLIEILAEKLGIDPFEIRKKNIYKVGSSTANGQIIKDGCPLDICLETVEREMKGGIIKSQSSDVEKNHSHKSIKKGRGIACGWYGTGYGNGFPDVSVAEIEMLSGGDILLRVGAAEVGQGAKTVMPQIAGEILGVNPDDITLYSEDTDQCLDSGTAAATRQTYNTGNAVKLTAESFKKLLIQEAESMLKDKGLSGNYEYVLCDNKIKVIGEDSIFLGFEEIAEKLEAEGRSLKSVESFTARTVQLDENGQGEPYWPYTFNTYGVEVEVDTETGYVKCLEAWCAQDVGRAINPKIIEGQIDGGFVMGQGYSLYEDLAVKDGKIWNSKYSKYTIPAALDIPLINKYLIESPEETAPFGAKGIGEPVIIPVAPAILNAIYNACGARITSLPATPEKILKAIESMKTQEGN